MALDIPPKLMKLHPLIVNLLPCYNGKKNPLSLEILT